MFSKALAATESIQYLLNANAKQGVFNSLKQEKK